VEGRWEIFIDLNPVTWGSIHRATAIDAGMLIFRCSKSLTILVIADAIHLNQVFLI
jgi:hypothetical protein